MAASVIRPAREDDVPYVVAMTQVKTRLETVVSIANV